MTIVNKKCKIKIDKTKYKEEHTMKSEQNTEWIFAFQEDVSNALMERFQINDDRTLLLYLLLRSATEDVKKGKVKNKSLSDWSTRLIHSVRKELSIEQDYGMYDNREVSLAPYSSHLRSLLDEWTTSVAMTGQHVWQSYCSEKNSSLTLLTFLTNKFDELLKSAKDHAKKLTKQAYYEHYLKHFYLIELNKCFEVEEVNDVLISNFEYEEMDSVNLEPSLEIYYKRYMDAFYFNHQEYRVVSEKSVEDYLEKHLNELEEGLRMFSRQLVLPNGRIDLLAKDSNGHLVVVEIKVKEDTDLVWQRQYYLEEIKNLYKTEHVRFFAVMPEEYPHITEQMKTFEDTELFTFTLAVSNKEISNITFKKSA